MRTTLTTPCRPSVEQQAFAGSRFAALTRARALPEVRAFAEAPDETASHAFSESVRTFIPAGRSTRVATMPSFCAAE